jgi:hypothetical protein
VTKPIAKAPSTPKTPSKPSVIVPMNPEQQILLEDMLDRTILQLPEEQRTIVTENIAGMSIADQIKFARLQLKVYKASPVKPAKPASQIPGPGAADQKWDGKPDWMKGEQGKKYGYIS